MSQLPLAGILLAALLVPAEAGWAQQQLGQLRCQTIYQGTPWVGVLVLERWSYARTFRYYGRFQDPDGNLAEFEVFTGDLSGGVGGIWVNHMRHRETHMVLEVSERSFTIHTEDGVVERYTCGGPGAGDSSGSAGKSESGPAKKPPGKPKDLSPPKSLQRPD